MTKFIRAQNRLLSANSPTSPKTRARLNMSRTAVHRLFSVGPTKFADAVVGKFLKRKRAELAGMEFFERQEVRTKWRHIRRSRGIPGRRIPAASATPGNNTDGRPLPSDLDQRVDATVALQRGQTISGTNWKAHKVLKSSFGQGQEGTYVCVYRQQDALNRTTDVSSSRICNLTLRFLRSVI